MQNGSLRLTKQKLSSENGYANTIMSVRIKRSACVRPSRKLYQILVHNRGAGHLQMFFVLALATGARPSSVLSLTKFQCDLERRLINLSPPGFSRTKKRRPIIPMCNTAARWIKACNAGPLVSSNGKTPLNDIFPPWREYKRAAGLPEDFTPGCIRHTVASELRRRGVPRWHLEALGGWRSDGGQTVERYAKFEPDYLRPAVEAIEELFEDIADRIETSLYPECAPIARHLPVGMVELRGIEPLTSTLRT